MNAHTFTPEEERLIKEIAACPHVGRPNVEPGEGFDNRNDPPFKPEPLWPIVREELAKMFRIARAWCLILLVLTGAAATIYFVSFWTLVLWIALACYIYDFTNARR